MKTTERSVVTRELGAEGAGPTDGNTPGAAEGSAGEAKTETN